MFKLTHTNKNGTFKVVLHRDISNSEMNALCQLAINIVPHEDTHSNSEQLTLGVIGASYGPQRPDQDAFSCRDQNKGQTKLGERPVDHINLGTYVEPADGVRIKMVSFVDIGKVSAVKAFREETGISALGCMAIVQGNYPCPVLTLDTARKIVDKFRQISVYARIIPAYEEAA